MKKKFLGILMILATVFAFNTAVLAEETTEEATTTTTDVADTTSSSDTTTSTDDTTTTANTIADEAHYFGDYVDFVNEPQTFTFKSIAYYPETVFTDRATGRTLVEGEDYYRTYITTRDKTLNPDGDFYKHPEKFSDNDFVSPGFIWENIEFTGKYFGKNIRIPRL